MCVCNVCTYIQDIHTYVRSITLCMCVHTVSIYIILSCKHISMHTVYVYVGLLYCKPLNCRNLSYEGTL